MHGVERKRIEGTIWIESTLCLAGWNDAMYDDYYRIGLLISLGEACGEIARGEVQCLCGTVRREDCSENDGDEQGKERERCFDSSDFHAGGGREREILLWD